MIDENTKEPKVIMMNPEISKFGSVKKPRKVVDIRLNVKEIESILTLLKDNGTVYTDIYVTNTGIDSNVEVVIDGKRFDVTDYECW